MSELLVNINGTEYSEKYNYMTVGYEQQILDTTVYVDGSDLINHFNITCDSNWIEIRRVRNKITLIIKKNNLIEDRVGLIEFTHNLNSDLYINISIRQTVCEYPISINPENILFEPLLDADDPEKTVETIHVTTENGICDFGIGTINEYGRNYVNGAYEGFYSIPYDNGVKLRKIDKQTLEITNYGKASLYDDIYYLITLYHVNNPKSNVRLRIDYVDSYDDNQNGFSLGDGE